MKDETPSHVIFKTHDLVHYERWKGDSCCYKCTRCGAMRLFDNPPPGWPSLCEYVKYDAKGNRTKDNPMVCKISWEMYQNMLQGENECNPKKNKMCEE